jgi:hypothetical protein
MADAWGKSNEQKEPSLPSNTAYKPASMFSLIHRRAEQAHIFFQVNLSYLTYKLAFGLT